jgi:hypothetical protein
VFARCAVMVGLVAAALAGCGGDDDDTSGEDAGEARPYVDALIANLTMVGEGQLELTQAQAGCVAPRWIEVMDIDRLSAAGVTPSSLADEGSLSVLQLSDEDAERMYEAFLACEVDVRQSFVDSLAAEAELSDDDARCLGEQIEDDLVRRFFITSLHEDEQGSAEDDQNFEDVETALAACGLS